MDFSRCGVLLMSPKQRIERAARVADKDFEVNLDTYLAMYRPKVYPRPVSETAERVAVAASWLAAIGIWAALLYVALGGPNA